MPSIAKTGQGTLFKVTNGSLVTIPEVMRVNAPNVKTELNDVTSHDSTGGFREFLPGQKDGETVSAEHNWVPSNVVHKQLRVDAYAATLKTFNIVFPDVSDNTVAFTGYITEVNPTANVGEPMRATTTVKVTGQPTWS
jgi:predicted secreted protein